MKHGLTSFRSFFGNKIKDLLENRENNKFGDIKPEQVFEFERAIDFVNKF